VQIRWKKARFGKREVEVMDAAAEVYVKESKPRRELGRIMLKGDNITLIQQAQ